MNEYIWADSVYKKVMLNSLLDLQKQNNMCDIKLTVGNEFLNAHKLVLSAVLPYFKIMEENKFVESQENEIKFHNIDFKILKQIIEYIYTGEIKINESNIFELMELADMFSISFLKLAFSDYIISTLTTNNCIEYLAYCKKYRYEELSKIILEYIWNNIYFIFNRKDFYETPSDILKLILFSSSLSVTNICTIFKKWLLHNDPGIKFNPVLKPLIYWKQLDEIDKNSKHSKFILEYKKYILKRMFVGLTNITPEIEEQIVDCNIYDQTGMERYNESEERWKQCPDIIYKRACHGACSNLGVMYVFGGISESGVSLDTVERYEETLEKWIEVSKMPEPRSNFGHAVFEKYIYIFGGSRNSKVNHETTICKSVFRYDTLSDVWERHGEILAPRQDMACCVRNDRIYITGGEDGIHEALSTTFIYNPTTGRCSQTVSPTRKPRIMSSLHCVRISPS